MAQRHLLKPDSQRRRIRPRVRFNIAEHNIRAGSRSLMGSLQHGIGLAYARRIAKEYLKPPLGLRLFLLPDTLQQLLRVPAFQTHSHPFTKAEFASPVFQSYHNIN